MLSFDNFFSFTVLTAKAKKKKKKKKKKREDVCRVVSPRLLRPYWLNFISLFLFHIDSFPIQSHRPYASIDYTAQARWALASTDARDAHPLLVADEEQPARERKPEKESETETESDNKSESKAESSDPLHPLLRSDPLALPADAGGGDKADANAETSAKSEIESETETESGAQAAGPSAGDAFVPWAARTADILARFSSNERIGVSAKFMGGEAAAVKLPVDQVHYFFIILLFIFNT